jgi:hypothetical protein
VLELAAAHAGISTDLCDTDDPMNDRAQPEPQRTKRAYSKPELVQIPLRPDEAVLGNCKTAGTSGPGATGNCSTPAPCFSIGS